VMTHKLFMFIWRWWVHEVVVGSAELAYFGRSQ
jgi:hypothetical protein